MDLNLLRQNLDEITSRFEKEKQIQNDPLSLILRFDTPQDREITALIAAVFAYGNVKQIQNSVGKVFQLLGPSPAKMLKSKNGDHWKKTIPKNFKHRFNTAEDLGLLLTWLGEALRKSGSIENFFIHSAGGILALESAEDIGPALISFVDHMTQLPAKPYKVPKTKGAKFFFPSPRGKSACKRLMLFLRWTVGSGPMDLNLWKNVPKSKLLIPVDTHVLRISQNLGLTRRKDNSWRTAQEITTALKKLDPQDPTRFDFALCHLGISQECPSRYNIKICTQCQMRTLCTRYKKGT